MRAQVSGQGKASPPRRAQSGKGCMVEETLKEYAMPFSSERASFLLVQGSESALRWENLVLTHDRQLELRKRSAKFAELARKLPACTQTYLFFSCPLVSSCCNASSRGGGRMSQDARQQRGMRAALLTGTKQVSE